MATTKTKPTLYQYKGNRCCHCGTSVEDVLARFGTLSQIFHFNHIDPKRKHPNYDNLIRRVLSSELLDEMDKCVLLCSFCHGILHGQGTAGEVTICSAVRGKSMRRTIKGQFILELPTDGSSTPKMSFFSDDEIKIIPYKVFVGGKRAKILTSGELDSDKRLIKLLMRTKTDGPLEIRSLHGEKLFEAQMIDDESLKVIARYSFSVMKAELYGDDGKPVIWIRGGRAIFRTGEVDSQGFYRFCMKYHDLEDSLRI